MSFFSEDKHELEDALQFKRVERRCFSVKERTAKEYGKPLVEWCLRSLPAMTAPGWFTCYCGCGYVGVCRHCVPDAPAWVPWQLCQTARLLVESGQYRCREGWLEVVCDG